MATTTNCRALLTAAMVLPAVAIARPAFAQASPAADTSEWDRLVRVLNDARTEYVEADRVFNRHEERACDAARAVVMPTEPAALSVAEVIANPHAWNEAWQAYDAARKAWKVEADAARAQVMDDVETQYHVSLNKWDVAVDAVRQHPVATLAMLRRKADILHAEYDGSLDENDASALIADIRRLADREG